MGHVVVGGGSKADDGDPQYAIVADREFVLPTGIGQRLCSLQMVDSLDLHDGAVRRPGGVEVIAAMGPPPPGLPIRLRKAVRPAEAGEVEFTDRLRTLGQVAENQTDQVPSAMSPDSGECRGQGLGGCDSLLHRHGEHEGGLPVRACPQRSSDRSDRGTDAWQAGLDQIARLAAARLVDLDVAWPAWPARLRRRHVQYVVEPAHPCRAQSRRPVEGGTWSDLEDRRPPGSRLRQLTGVYCESLTVVRRPAPRPQLGRDLPTREPQPSKLGARYDAGLLASQLSGQVSKLPAPSARAAVPAARFSCTSTPCHTDNMPRHPSPPTPHSLTCGELTHCVRRSAGYSPQIFGRNG
ncbi:hypothetical protein EV645_1080 [Kribbella rubisoli]|uniref:Uncharacterized protein n=1 Tax=Kribbella rubisoli TaxID=3075929 RepID=A0A4Q7X717_9ACTN|nr:hypothetical protein EV645_1080 [Kribbella rubisoli]